MPDMFAGDSIPLTGLTDPSFNMTAWRDRHTTASIDSIVASTIQAMRGEMGVKKLGAVGYW